ncbi:nuclear mRNA export, poly(A)+RNA binding protein [Coemansia thaxteri]|uniref:mRNA export factor MEX67 n=1 Tax=Coemansia thaxteri TaxID=2663907 RepID=A0A9W8BAA6_9FUNG|nr:nuclear mRNA export, poly(A)+RNA binding protein [Coemansia thaxteri]KAJ1999905.1 nuclear mRNA export, poly(A)+RNA binding protein [Coemansia thaxteri]
MSHFFSQSSRSRGRGRGRGRGYYGGGQNPMLSHLGAEADQYSGPAGAGAMAAGNAAFADTSMVGYAGGPVQVSIKGWGGGTEPSLIKFLDNKTGRSINIKSVNYRGDIMYISVPSMEIAQELLKLSGIRFAGDKLIFQLKIPQVRFGADSSGREMPGRSAASESVNIKDRLINLLQTRVDMQGGSLDLSSLAQDNIIKSIGANPLHDGKIFKAILVIAAQIYPSLVTISFADNGFRTLRPIADLGMHFPGLRNLSLMNNLIADLRELDCLSSAGSTVPLGQLAELILSGNPVCETELRQPNGGASYVDKVHQRFPTVNMLDMNPVQPRAQPGLATQSAGERAVTRQFPFSTEQSFVENQGIGDMANAFLAGFFGLYDQNRSGLADIYDHSAQFSLIVDTAPPTNAFAQTKAQSQKHVDLSVYIRISRNLARVKSPAKRMSALVVGRDAIIQTILQLPATQHPVQDAQRFSFDAWQVEVPSASGGPQTVAALVIHGEFTECQSQNVISFDRVFALAPAPPGSPAAAIGSPCVIVNDMLTLRRYNGFHSWLAMPTDTPAATSGLAPEQQEMARALQEQTGLNAEWTLKCLENYGWNCQLALSEFPQVRGTLPPEAFK